MVYIRNLLSLVVFLSFNHTCTPVVFLLCFICVFYVMNFSHIFCYIFNVYVCYMFNKITYLLTYIYCIARYILWCGVCLFVCHTGIYFVETRTTELIIKQLALAWDSSLQTLNTEHIF